MLKKADQFFVRANQFVVGGLMLVMFILVFGNVVSRYVFSYSINWIEELSRFLMIWITFLGAGLAMREGRHVSIEMVQDWLPKKALPFVRTAVGLIMILFLGFVAFLGFEYAMGSMDQQTTVLRWSTGLIYFVIPLGMLMFVIHFLSVFREYTKETGYADRNDHEEMEHEENRPPVKEGRS